MVPTLQVILDLNPKYRAIKPIIIPYHNPISKLLETKCPAGWLAGIRQSVLVIEPVWLTLSEDGEGVNEQQNRVARRSRVE